MPTQKIYGEPMVALYSLLDNLRLKYKDYNKNSARDRFIDIPDFGIRIRIADVVEPRPEDVKLDVLQYSQKFDVKAQEEFGEMLMWKIIAAGYMAYIRQHREGGRERIYATLVVNHGWGRKILDKRIAYLKTLPTRKFICSFTEKLLEDFSIYELTQRYPGLFDYLY